MVPLALAALLAVARRLLLLRMKLARKPVCEAYINQGPDIRFLAARADDNIPTDYPLRSVGGFMNAAAGEAELVQRRRARRVQPLRTMESVEKSRAHIEAEQPTKSGGTMAEESSGALTLVVVKLTRGETVMKGCHCGVVFHWETGYD